MPSRRGGPPAELIEAVLAVVEGIPPARVLTYGDIAEIIGFGGPRGVGWAMAHSGGEVAWWRVVRADGRPPAGHEDAAVQCYLEEGTPLRPASTVAGDRRIDLARARLTPEEWQGIDQCRP